MWEDQFFSRPLNDHFRVELFHQSPKPTLNATDHDWKQLE